MRTCSMHLMEKRMNESKYNMFVEVSKGKRFMIICLDCGKENTLD